MAENRYEITFVLGEGLAKFKEQLLERVAKHEDKELQDTVISLIETSTVTVKNQIFQKIRGFMAQAHVELGYREPMVSFKKHSEIPLAKDLTPKKAKVPKVFKPTRRSFFLVTSFNPASPALKLEWFCRDFEKAKEEAMRAAEEVPDQLSGIVSIQEYKLDSSFSRAIMRYTTEAGSGEVKVEMIPLVPEPKKAKQPKPDARIETVTQSSIPAEASA